ncbi:MAG: metalloregulator ArsR/SmtB family transcription factor [bacterium]
MTTQTHNRRIKELQARADVFKALAHPTRLLILQELADGERCVGDLTEIAGFDMSTVSKHLTVLKSAGIVADQKRGLEVWYRLCMPCVLSFFDCVAAVLKARHLTPERRESSL